MGIIIKFILKNVKSNKFRTFLIITSIAISTALFFASMAISLTVENMYRERIKTFYGGAEIQIHANSDSPGDYIKHQKATECKNIEYAVGILTAGGYYNRGRDELIPLKIRGMELDDLKTMGSFVATGKTNIEPFSGNKVIIAKSAAKKYDLTVGDSIDIEILDHKKRFKIGAISEGVGFFAENGNSMTVVAPINTLSDMYGSKGSYTELYIKLLDKERTIETLEELSAIYKGYTVKETITKEEIDFATSGISIPFIMMTGVVLFMSIFIMNTSYKVIITERLPVIGTFRSIGATKRSTDSILLIESMTYGVIGGILGCILGLGVLYVMALNITDWGEGMSINISYNAFHFISAFSVAFILSIISSYFPIRKAAKTSVKDIILSTTAKAYINKRWKAFLGGILLPLSILIPPIVPRRLILVVGFCAMMMSIFSIVLLIPHLNLVFIKIFEKAYSKVFGNEGILAAKNLRQNRSILNNTSLLAIGISGVFMINTISGSVMKEVTNFYNNMAFDVFFCASQLDRNTLNVLRGIEGSEGAYGIYELIGTATDRGTVRISLLQGIETVKFREYLPIDFGKDGDALLMKLNEGRNILLANSLKDQLEAFPGDVIGIDMPKGMRYYNVLGFYNSLMCNGSYALISDKYFRLDTGDKYFTEIYIKSKEPENVAAKLKKKFARRYPWARTMAEAEKDNREGNEMMFSLMLGFSVAAMIIGIFGVLNNYTISFMERKRYLAMYRSLGMSKGQMMKMLFIEALSGGFVGGFMGAVGGVILIYTIPGIMKYIGVDIPMHYSWSYIWISILSGALISVVASLSPGIKSSRLSIIDNIKYE